MTIYSISAIINFLACGLLTIFVAGRKPRNSINIAFAFFAGVTALWSLGYFFWQMADTEDSAIFFVRLLMAFAVFIPVTYLHFVIRFTELYEKKSLFLKACYALFFGFFLINFTPFFVAGVRPIQDFKYWPLPGLFFHPFLILWFASLVYAGWLLYQKYKISTGNVHDQILYIFSGMILGFLGGSTNYFLWYGIPVLPVGNFLVSVYVGVMAYAIIKLHLLDIKIITTQIFSAIITLITAAEVFFASSVSERVGRTFIFVLTAIFSALLVRNVAKEIKTRERAEQLAQDLEMANEHLRVLDKQKSEFVSIASHQLRSPLTAIIGYSSMLLEGSYGKLPKKAIETTDKIYQSGRRLAATIDDFLTISHIEQGKMTYTFMTVEIWKVIKEIVDGFVSPAQDKEMELNFTTDGYGDYKVTADDNKIRQVLSNLIDNAIKYGKAGEPISIFLSKNLDTKKTRIAVRDSGIGMSQETINSIFQKFSRAEGVRKVYTDGSGIGLYVASEMIKAHHGRIWVESEGEGKGSTFFVELMSEED